MKIKLKVRYMRYKFSGKSCIVIKYKNDTRYDSRAMVVTHDNIKVEATPCEYLCEVNELVKDYDVICIDEVQFYKDAPAVCDKWANQGKIIVASGLSGTFNRTPFPVISNLIPLSETIIMLDAICEKTGNNAPFTKLLIENTTGGVEIIGGNDKYAPVDRQTYFTDINDK